MKFYISLINLLFIANHCFSQTDTLIREQRGILFLSAHNYMYDYNGAANEVKLLGFHDFFYPSTDLTVKGIVNTSKSLCINNGVRVDYFDLRPSLKKRAVSIDCLDTTKCYRYDKFYLVPVFIKYKEFTDYEPSICGKYQYDLLVCGNHSVKFKYSQRAIIISSIRQIKRK
jgi:hypothetical protein